VAVLISAVGGDEARPSVDQPDGAGDGLEGVGPGLAEHDVVRVLVGHHVADVVDRRGQPRLAHDVRRTARALVIEELRGRQRGRPDRLLRHVDAAAAQQPHPQVARGEDRVVGQDQEGDLLLAQGGDELLRPRDRVLLAHEDPVHVGQPGADGAGVGHGCIVS
jgi:hypothetical protein